jgi:hypothetical protein
MSTEYKVVLSTELVQPPSILQSPAARIKQFTVALEDALNDMAAEGWDLVDSSKEPWSGALLFVFRRARLREKQMA